MNDAGRMLEQLLKRAKKDGWQVEYGDNCVTFHTPEGGEITLYGVKDDRLEGNNRPALPGQAAGDE